MAHTLRPLLPWPALNVLDERSMPAHCEAIASVMEWLEGVGEQQQWHAKSLFALTLCADEALTNIATHAQAPSGQALRIELMLGQLDDGVALCIADNGAAFDPTSRDSAELAENLDEADIGGHGLRLMRHYLQRFEYQRVGGWNWLLLGVSSPAA